MVITVLAALRATTWLRGTTFARAYASQSHSFHASAPAPTAEPKDNLHYHPFPHPPPGRFALSFLPDAPQAYNSKTVLGFLPLSQDSVGLDDFRENPGFRSVVLISQADFAGKLCMRLSNRALSRA